MFLYSKGISNNFSHIAMEHLEKLVNQQDRNGVIVYKRGSIINKINLLLLAADGSENFFSDLLANDKLLLKKIITGEPKDLSEVIEGFQNNIDDGRYPLLHQTVDGRLVLSDFGRKIVKVFNYDAFSVKKKSWCAYDMCDLIGIDVCPYCNRNYTFTLRKKDNGVVRPELDHFLPKFKFPYLALSFYNLIPSCHLCNSNLKHHHDFNLEKYLHPYVTSFDEVVQFSIRFHNKSLLNKEDILKHYGIDFFYGDAKSFKITIKARTNDKSLLRKALNNIQTFKIRELYNKHKDLIQEIIQTSLIYNEDYIQALLNNYEGQLFRNRDDVLRHITRNYPDPVYMPNRPFSKLTKDVFHEFGLKY